MDWYRLYNSRGYVLNAERKDEVSTHVVQLSIAADGSTTVYNNTNSSVHVYNGKGCAILPAFQNVHVQGGVSVHSPHTCTLVQSEPSTMYMGEYTKGRLHTTLYTDQMYKQAVHIENVQKENAHGHNCDCTQCSLEQMYNPEHPGNVHRIDCTCTRCTKENQAVYTELAQYTAANVQGHSKIDDIIAQLYTLQSLVYKGIASENPREYLKQIADLISKEKTDVE